MRRLLIIGLVIFAFAGAWYAYNRYQAGRQASALADFQTAPAARGDLTATVGATGTVRANQTAVLTWQTTGAVGMVSVAVGDQAAVDQVLASLEQASLAQNVILAQAELVSAQKTLDDLQQSGVQRAQAQKTVEVARQALDDLRNPELAQAEAQTAIAAAQKAVDDAERWLNILQSAASQASIDAAQAQVILARNALDHAQEDFQPYENKPENNLTRANFQARLAAAQQIYDAAVRNLNGMLGEGDKTDLALAAANLEQARAELVEAERVYDRIKAGPTVADIGLAEAQLAEAERAYDRIKAGPHPDDLAAAEARMAAAQATLDLQRLAAPFAGTITDLRIKPGDQVSPGKAAFRLDDLSHLLLDVQISEVDINRISLGQEVTLSFDAIQGQDYHGKVVEVTQAGESVQGVVEFTVTVELTDADAAVKPGMTAAVNIVVQQLADVLLVPNRAVRVQDGQRVVFILVGSQLQPVEIRLGASSESDSQVLESELKEGDQIVLNPPLEFEQGGPPSFLGR